MEKIKIPNFHDHGRGTYNLLSKLIHFTESSKFRLFNIFNKPTLAADT